MPYISDEDYEFLLTAAEKAGKAAKVFQEENKILKAQNQSYKVAEKRGFMVLPSDEIQNPQNRDDKATLSFIDKDGNKHKAYAPDERISEQDIEPGTFGRILRSKITGDMSGLSKFEKSQAEGSGALGGWLVPSSVSTDIIDLARNEATVLKAGANTLPMQTTEMTLVKIDNDPTAYWRKEHAEITESEGSFSPITLKAVVIGCLVRASIELIEDAGNSISVLEDMIGKALAVEMDRVALFGNGTSEPLGLDLCSSINSSSMGTNGGALTDYDDISSAMEDVELVNGKPTAAIMNPRSFYALDRLKDTTGQPLMPPKSYADLKKFRTNQIPINDVQGTASNASKIFIGDFSQMLFGVRTDLKTEFSREADDAFKKMDVLIRVYGRMDVAILKENHFSKIYGIIPA